MSKNSSNSESKGDEMELSKEEVHVDVVKYINHKNNLFDELVCTFKDFIFQKGSAEDCQKRIFNAFLNFRRDANLRLDFEFSEKDFEVFESLSFNENQWISVYVLFSDVFNRDSELDTFLNLFFCDLIYSGPFSEDLKGLDMSDELLDLMRSDVKRLYCLFDDYFNTRNPDLIADIVDVCKREGIPYFMVDHLAEWIADDIERDELKRKEFGEIACELYAVAINKIYNRPILYEDDIFEVSGLKGELEMSQFSEDTIEKTFSKMNSNKRIKIDGVTNI